jgi:ABC-2 type transport system permease protein
MSPAAGGRGGGWAVVGVLWRRDLTLFLREGGRIAAAVAQPIFFWLLLGSGFGAGLRTAGVPYLEYFFPGMVLMVVLFAAIFSTITIIEDRQQGFLRAVLAAPVPRAGVVLGKILGSATLCFAQGLAVLLLTPTSGIPVHPVGFAAACLVLFLIAYGLSGLGIALAWVSSSTAGYHAAMNLLLLPLWFLSGALFPPAGVPEWLAWVMRVDPLSYGLQALREALYLPGASPLGHATAPAAVAWTVCVGFAVLGHVLAALAARGTARPA